MPTESLLSDKDITIGSWFLIEGDEGETRYSLELLSRCPGNAILHYELPSGRVISTPPTKAELIKGEVIIAWCDSIRGQDTLERETDNEANELIRQKRIRAEDAAAVVCGYTSHNDMLEKTGGNIISVGTIPPASDGGIVLPPGTVRPSAPTPPAAELSIVERLVVERSQLEEERLLVVDRVSSIEAEIEQLGVAIGALT